MSDEQRKELKTNTFNFNNISSNYEQIREHFTTKESIQTNCQSIAKRFDEKYGRMHGKYFSLNFLRADAIRRERSIYIEAL
jgi:hypothetical protein